MTQNQSITSSTKLTQSEAVANWEKKLLAQDDRWRASGHTVTVQEPSDSTEFVASFPQGKRPPAQPPNESLVHGKPLTALNPSILRNG